MEVVHCLKKFLLDSFLEVCCRREILSQKDRFQPFPIFRGKHLQTIIANIFPFYSDFVSQQRFFHLRDGEKLSLEISIPQKWKESALTVVMLHGVCGSHASPYLVRMTGKLYQQDVRVVRVNLKGCGSGRGYAKKVYHPDCSYDLWEVIQDIKKETPDSPLVVIGFSFGGNVALKMAGEMESEAEKVVDKVIAVNPPVDLYATAKLLSRNRIYEEYFMHYFRSEVAFLHDKFHTKPAKIPWGMRVIGFDQFYLAPMAGYRSAKEYYHAMSSGRVLPMVKVPCFILFSRDDPIVDAKVLDEVRLPSHIKVVATERGGHLGFLGKLGSEGGFHWMDSLLLKWIFSPVEKAK